MDKDVHIPQLMLPREYIKMATKLVKQAQHRVYLVCLNLNRSPETNKLIDEIMAAAQRGVDVRIGNDLLTFICDHEGSVASRLVGPEMLHTRSIRKDFLKSGAQFHWLGLQSVPYVIGRTHSKWTIIDDHIFSFGGVNLSHAGIAERTDYMFYVVDHDLADRLAKKQLLIESAAPNRQFSNMNIKTNFGNVLIDGGKFGHSLIYNHAIKLARESTELVVVSQYCPSGKLGKIIRHRSAKLFFNPKGSADTKVNNFMIGTKSNTSNQTNLYTRSRYLHAKFIIGKLPNGSKRAITGSHNFAAISGKVGTREIALETTEPHVISQLEKFLDDYIA